MSTKPRHDRIFLILGFAFLIAGLAWHPLLPFHQSNPPFLVPAAACLLFGASLWWRSRKQK